MASNSRNRKANSLASAKRQSGATLIVGLIVLAIITLLTVSSMSDMGVQTSMVRNSQTGLLAFNTVMNDLNAQIDKINIDNDEGLLLSALDTVDRAPVTMTDADHVENQGDLFELEGEVQFVLEKPLSGFSAGVYRGLVFEFDETARMTATNAESRQVQGIYYIAPK